MILPTYIIRADRRVPGVRLSLLGSWGNLPFPCADTARKEAIRHAAGAQYLIERQGC